MGVEVGRPQRERLRRGWSCVIMLENTEEDRECCMWNKQKIWNVGVEDLVMNRVSSPNYCQTIYDLLT